MRYPKSGVIFRQGMKLIFFSCWDVLKKLTPQDYHPKPLILNLESSFVPNSCKKIGYQQILIQDLFSDSDRIKLQNAYIACIGNLNIEHQGLDWWAYTFTSKNPLTSSLYFRVYYSMLILKLLKKDTNRNIFIFCPGVTYISIISRFLRNHTDVRVIQYTPLDRNIKSFLKKIQFLWNIAFLFKTSCRILVSRIFLRGISKKQKFEFVFLSLILKKNWGKKIYLDHYFSHFLNHLRENNNLVVVDVIKGFWSQMKLFKEEHSKYRVLPLERFLKWRDLCSIYIRQCNALMKLHSHDYLNKKTSILSDFLPHELWVSLIKLEMKESIHWNTYAKNLLFYYSFKNLSQKTKIQRFLYPFENRSLEKMSLLAFKEHLDHKPHLEGYQHAAIHLGHMNFRLIEGEAPIIPLPDKIWTTGKGPLNYLIEKGNFPKPFFSIGGGIRQSWSEKLKTEKRRNFIQDILVVFASGYFEYYGILQFLSKCKLDIKYHFILRAHPEFEIEEILKQFDLSHLNISVDQNLKISGAFRQIDAICYTSSSVCIEALSHGIPAICIHYGGALNMDPLFEGAPLKWDLYNPYNFEELMEKIQSQVHREDGKKINTNMLEHKYFEPFNHSKILRTEI